MPDSLYLRPRIVGKLKGTDPHHFYFYVDSEYILSEAIISEIQTNAGYSPLGYMGPYGITDKHEWYTLKYGWPLPDRHMKRYVWYCYDSSD